MGGRDYWSRRELLIDDVLTVGGNPQRMIEIPILLRRVGTREISGLSAGAERGQEIQPTVTVPADRPFTNRAWGISSVASGRAKNCEEQTGHHDGRRRRKTGGNPSIEEAKTSRSSVGVAPGGEPLYRMRALSRGSRRLPGTTQDAVRPIRSHRLDRHIFTH